MAAALDGLLAMRAQEGTAIVADLRGRLGNLRALVEKIAALTAAVPGRAARRLEERLAVLAATTPAIDPSRLAQEVALLAERLDVSEEIVRLRAHFDHLASLLDGQGKDAPGRRIDFLAQEIGRELNTLGGKIQDAAIAGAGHRRQGRAGEAARAGAEYRVERNGRVHAMSNEVSRGLLS